MKIYRPNTHPNFPHGGKFTPFLEEKGVGDRLLIEAPFGQFDYQPGGTALIKGEPHKVKRVFFIAGGSGITPIFQVLMELARMKEPLELILLFANKTE